MFTLTVKMPLQMFYSNIMAHMPSAYGLGKNTIFNKVQFSSVQRHHEDKLSKATSSLFTIKMIAKLEWT